MKGNRVFTTISPVLNEQLEARAKEGGCTTSQIISIALTNYLGPPNVASITKEDLEGLRETLMNTTEFMRKYPLTLKECFPEPPTPYIQNGMIVTKEIQEGIEEISKGIIMPDMTKTRVRPDPSIKHVSLFAYEIKPGPGVTNRLLAAGITPIDIVKAKRNRAAGRDWDQSLEPYFDLM